MQCNDYSCEFKFKDKSSSSKEGFVKFESDQISAIKQDLGIQMDKTKS